MQLTPSILDDFRAGRLQSFYAEAYAPLLTYAARLLGERYALLAEDCVQDAIFASYERRDSISDVNQWKTFLFRLVHNSAISIIRHQQAQEHYLNEQADLEDDFLRSMIQQETLDSLFTAIRSLPQNYQRLFQLSFVQGLRNKDVAEILQVSIRAVTKQKSRLFSMVRKSLSSLSIIHLFI